MQGYLASIGGGGGGVSLPLYSSFSSATILLFGSTLVSIQRTGMSRQSSKATTGQ